uniref:homeobox protein Hox-B8a n=1 Tax=Monopterus albus TaxID=43700 RepID=UPI0009B2FDDA|nr:uncharacterized protein LOC109964705 [Monopterus albus]
MRDAGADAYGLEGAAADCPGTRYVRTTTSVVSRRTWPAAGPRPGSGATFQHAPQIQDFYHHSASTLPSNPYQQSPCAVTCHGEPGNFYGYDALQRQTLFGAQDADLVQYSDCKLGGAPGIGGEDAEGTEQSPSPTQLFPWMRPQASVPRGKPRQPLGIVVTWFMRQWKKGGEKLHGSTLKRPRSTNHRRQIMSSLYFANALFPKHQQPSASCFTLLLTSPSSFFSASPDVSSSCVLVSSDYVSSGIGSREPPVFLFFISFPTFNSLLFVIILFLSFGTTRDQQGYQSTSYSLKRAEEKYRELGGVRLCPPLQRCSVKRFTGPPQRCLLLTRHPEPPCRGQIRHQRQINHQKLRIYPWMKNSGADGRQDQQTCTRHRRTLELEKELRPAPPDGGSRSRSPSASGSCRARAGSRTGEWKKKD